LKKKKKKVDFGDDKTRKFWKIFSKVNGITPKNSNVGGTRYEQKLL